MAPTKPQDRLAPWSYAGIILTILMGAACPFALFDSPFLRCGADSFRFMAGATLGSLAIWGCMAFLWLISSVTPHRIGILCRAAIALGALVMATDVVVVLLFSCRLYLRDAIAFGGDLGTWLRFLEAGVDHPTMRLVLAGLTASWTMASVPIFVLHRPRRPSARWFYSALAGSVLFFAAGIAPIPFARNERALACSVWELAIRDTFARRFSEPFKRHVADRLGMLGKSVLSPLPLVSPNRPDIVILVIESWSSYHSHYFGGRRNWTPELDRVATLGLAFTNCIANGLNTEDGLIALLTGEEPFMPAGSARRGGSECFNGFHSAERNLARLLRPAGYTCYYSTSGPLDFSRKRQFLDSLGFDFLSDIHDDSHKGDALGKGPWLHGLFGPPDEAVYLRNLALMDQIRIGRHEGKDAGPVMLFIETTSSHLPWTCPDGPPHTEERVMRYVDREAGRFIHRLEDDGFFRDGGLMVVVSDHRAMVPVRADEIAAFGQTAPWRIPMFFLADWLSRRGRDARLVSQADVVPTLEWLVTGSAPLAGRRCILLCPEAPPACFQAARVPSDRSAAAAWDTRTGAVGTIRWNGDKSSATRGLEDALLWLTWERMQRENRPAAGTGPLEHARWLGGSSATEQARLTPQGPTPARARRKNTTF